MSFFILRLPRSRTAWLANFLTYDGMVCFHDGLNGVSSIDEYKKKINGCGDSNTGLALFDFERHFPDRKVIVIDSSVERSIEFGKDIYGIDLTEEFIKLKKRLDIIAGMHISLSDIDRKLKEIWNYVYSIPFNEDRARELSEINIQANPYDIDHISLVKLRESFNDFA